MKIWICIPVFNRKELTLKCLASLQKQQLDNFTVVVCDHGSTDGTSEAIKQNYPDVVVINADSSLWWTGAINRSISYALEHANNDDVLLTMNNDNEVPEDYLHNLATNYRKYPNSIITSVVYDIKTGELISRGYRQNWLLAKANPVDFVKDHLPNDPNAVEVTHASGRGTLFPTVVFKKLGLFDEQHLPHYAADYDFSFKAARANYKIYSCLDCKVFSYVEETGMVTVLNTFSLKSFIDYFTSIRSPANLKARWWYGWNNCPIRFLPIYFMFDFIRISGSYFKSFIHKH
jgi:GT2 family glycosyltransferase